MENLAPGLMFLFLCCGWPMLIGFVGYGLGKGWSLRSPITPPGDDGPQSLDDL